MSKGTKIVILILTILPVVLSFGGYVAMFATMMATALSESARHTLGGRPMSPPVLPMVVFFVSIALAGMISFGMLIFYVINVIVTNRVPKDLKPVWGVLFFVSWWIASVVYWYMYIWREPEAGPEVTTSIPTSGEHWPEPHAPDL